MSPSDLPGSGTLPRELVLASAGTGKTYTLSGRMIGLLAAGAPPDDLLASTFTRKAAGEVLNRVLGRLAEACLDPEKARELATDTLLQTGDHPLETKLALFQEVLRNLVRDLHRLNVGTLDSFFIRVARSFSPELGLPPEWSISDEPTARRLESEALLRVLQEPSREAVVELVRMSMRGESGRGIHDRLLDQLRDLRELAHQMEPHPETDPWGPVSGAGPEVSREERERVAGELEKAPIPRAKNGQPDNRFSEAVTGAADALRRGDWEEFCKKGLGAKLLNGADTYYKKTIPEDIQTPLRQGLSLAARALGLELAHQARALQVLVSAFDTVLSHLQRSQGAFRFHDITFLLGGPDAVGALPDVWYRLDQHARHLLLDEFQDTALVQWEALFPLAEELLSGRLEDRSATVVADPKQSIYGWRGADPELVRRVGERFSLQTRTLDRSYRSSAPVLEFVNRIFRRLPENPVWGEDTTVPPEVGEWAEGFPIHLPARELPGHVRVLAGPRELEMGRSDRPAMMAWAAERIAELTREMPGRTMGVLVRRNATVARLMVELRRLGVAASEEGATPLEDSPAVSTLLALLRLADHPGDTISEYQVRHSPLRTLFTSEEEGSPAWASSLAAQFRAALVARGYGPTLTDLTARLGAAGELGQRDLHRLLQLTELGYRWDERPTLRPSDFVRFVISERMEAPLDTAVRVMTVHQAKGLEFDIVVLPEMDLRLSTGQGRHKGVIPLRDPRTGRVIRIFPRLAKELRPLFPELVEAAQEDVGGELRDALGVLYVALTRARHALHILLAEDSTSEPKTTPLTFAGVIRGALGLDRTGFQKDQSLFELGDPDWDQQAGGATGGKAVPAAVSPPEITPPTIRKPKLARRPQRRRNLHHRAPSSLVGGDRADLRTLLSLKGDPARQRGSVIHAWLQTLSWLEEWVPDEELLRSLARQEGPGFSPEEVESLREELDVWLRADEVKACLARGSHPQGARVETEFPFAVAMGRNFFTGKMDRVILLEEEGRVVAAELLDYKTDAIPPGDEEGLLQLADEYKPQLETYRGALAKMFGLSLSQVKASLVFLYPGRVVELSPELKGKAVPPEGRS